MVRTVMDSTNPSTPRRWTLDDIALQHELEQFLYDEAALLDDRKFEDWYALLADDLEYWMPVRANLMPRDESGEFSKIGDVALFDEDKELMGQRVRKLYTGFAWSEQPQSRTRHLIANVRVLDHISAAEYKVASNFIVYRARLARDEDVWAGWREDVLRKVNGSWLIARRHIFLDQVSLGSKNLSIFF